MSGHQPLPREQSCPTVSAVVPPSSSVLLQLPNPDFYFFPSTHLSQKLNKEREKEIAVSPLFSERMLQVRI